MKYYLVILIFVALASGVLFSFRIWSDLPSGDGVHHDNFAQSLVKSGRFAENGKLTAQRDPGYAFFLSLLYRIFGTAPIWVKLAQLVLFVAAALLAYFLAWEIFASERYARWSGLGVAILYPLARQVGFYYSEILFTFLLLASTLLLTRALRTDQAKWFLASGIVFGLATLTRSVTIYFPVLLLALLYIYRDNLKKIAFNLLIFFIAFGIVIVPWMYRNQVQFHKFGLSTQEGSVLFFAVQRLKISNHDLPKVVVANTLGDFFARKFFGSYDRQAIEEGNFGKRYRELGEENLTTDQINSIVLTEAKTAINSHPLRYLLIVPPLEFLKLHTPIFPFESIQGLFADPSRYTQLSDSLKVSLIIAVRLVYLFFYVLVVWGMIQSRKYSRHVFVAFLLILYLVGVYSILHGITRYIIPILPYYIIFASLGWYAFRERFTNRSNQEKI